jgi:hypothetical protein
MTLGSYMGMDGWMDGWTCELMKKHTEGFFGLKMLCDLSPKKDKIDDLLRILSGESLAI